MALNVATLALILCRQVKTIKHGSVRINIVHFPIHCFLNFCSAVPTTFFSFLMIFLLVYMYTEYSYTRETVAQLAYNDYS